MQLSKPQKTGSKCCSVIGCQLKPNNSAFPNYCRYHGILKKKSKIVDDLPIDKHEKAKMAFSYIQKVKKKYLTIESIPEALRETILKELFSLLAIEQLPVDLFKNIATVENSDILGSCGETMISRNKIAYTTSRKFIEKRILFSMYRLPLDFKVTEVKFDLDYVDIKLKTNIARSKKDEQGYKSIAGTFIQRDQLIAFMKHLFMEGLDVKLYLDKIANNPNTKRS